MKCVDVRTVLGENQTLYFEKTTGRLCRVDVAAMQIDKGEAMRRIELGDYLTVDEASGANIPLTIATTSYTRSRDDNADSSESNWRWRYRLRIPEKGLRVNGL